MKDTQKMVEDLMDIDNYHWMKKGYESRPSGRDYMLLVLDIANDIAWKYPDGNISDEVQHILENENYHTLNTAIDIVKELAKRA